MREFEMYEVTKECERIKTAAEIADAEEAEYARLVQRLKDQCNTAVLGQYPELASDPRERALRSADLYVKLTTMDAYDEETE